MAVEATVADCRGNDLHRVIEDRLERAGATLLALPTTGWPSGMRCGWGEVVNDYREAYGWSAATVQPATPSAAAISAMDEAMSWLSLIPDSNQMARRIVAARSLVSAITGRHVFTWRRLGEKLSLHHTIVQRWHAQGIGHIVQALLVREIA